MARSKKQTERDAAQMEALALNSCPVCNQADRVAWVTFMDGAYRPLSYRRHCGRCASGFGDSLYLPPSAEQLEQLRQAQAVKVSA